MREEMKEQTLLTMLGCFPRVLSLNFHSILQVRRLRGKQFA